jgi:hypothetical protein
VTPPCLRYSYAPPRRVTGRYTLHGPAAALKYQVPQVTYSDDGGRMWKDLPTCDLVKAEAFNRAMKELGWALDGVVAKIVANIDWLAVRSCPLLPFGANASAVKHFYPYTVSASDSVTAVGYVPYANYDSAYLVRSYGSAHAGGGCLKAVASAVRGIFYC